MAGGLVHQLNKHTQKYECFLVGYLTKLVELNASQFSKLPDLAKERSDMFLMFLCLNWIVVILFGKEPNGVISLIVITPSGSFCCVGVV
jgi:hypothetical protein